MTEKPATHRPRSATDREVAALREPGRHSIGGSLILVVGTTGTRSWIGRVRDPSKRRRDIGLGSYPQVSLKEARERVAEHRRLAREGIDPVAAKQAAARSMPTFEKAARAVHDERKGGHRNAKHSQQWINTLRDYAFPKIGNKPVDEIDGPSVIRILKPIWTAKPETASRVLQRIATVVAWATAHGLRDHELAVKAIRMGLPNQPRKKGHHAAVAVEAAPDVVSQLRALPECASRAVLELVILTAARSNEARGARWSEIDLEAATWTVPAERMKADEEHVVALSPTAVAFLRAQPRIANRSGLVFPNSKGNPLSDVAISKSLKAVAPDATVHGWRSTFRDWAAERTATPGDVVEAALAHGNPNRVEAAYRRTKYLEKRRPLMQAWAAFLANEGADVASMDDARRERTQAA